MSVFGSYAQYYDLLYQDKDYDSEANFIHKLIQDYAINTKSILELGCGTGIHAEKLAAKGYLVHGIDMSDEMLNCAKERQQYIPDDVNNRLSFSCADIRNFKIDLNFDVVISLFHGISYQTENNDLKSVF